MTKPVTCNPFFYRLPLLPCTSLRSTCRPNQRLTPSFILLSFHLKMLPPSKNFPVSAILSFAQAISSRKPYIMSQSGPRFVGSKIALVVVMALLSLIVALGVTTYTYGLPPWPHWSSMTEDNQRFSLFVLVLGLLWELLSHAVSCHLRTPFLSRLHHPNRNGPDPLQ